MPRFSRRSHSFSFLFITMLVGMSGLVEESALEVFHHDGTHLLSSFYYFDGVVIAAQCTATFFKIYCAPPNLGITRT